MAKKIQSKAPLACLPLTSRRWPDFENLFGPNGACGGCWCMWWRIKRSQYDQQKGEGNRLAMRAIVDAGQVPGLLAYQDQLVELNVTALSAGRPNRSANSAVYDMAK